MAARPWWIAAALLAAVGFVSCEFAFPIETQNVVGPNGSLDGGDASGGSAGSGGSDGGACFPGPGQKFCGGNNCPSTNNPDYGCANASCTKCPAINGIASCAPNGQCAITCNAGFADCNNKTSDGCEIDTNTDPHHCGVCDRNCFVNTSSSNWECAGGTCKPSNCAVGSADCADAGTCGTDLNSDVNNCGSCGHKCNATNAVAACQNGQCTVACKSGFANCDGNPNNGCEANLSTSVTNCGACGRVCSTSHVIQLKCSGGVCTPTCASGYGNCSQPASPSPDDGCETQLDSLQNCGSCGKACPNTTDYRCLSGSCCVLGGHPCAASSDCCAGACSTFTPQICCGLAGANCTYNNNCCSDQCNFSNGTCK